MDPIARRFTGAGALLAPALHSFTDVMEWLHAGFSPIQLWLNYIAFLPLPAVLLGLYVAQRPKIGTLGLCGALGYGFAFIYFTHTTLLALALDAPNYESLWQSLGATYTGHGILMIAAGTCFGLGTLKARVFPTWTAVVFLLGVALNLVVGLLPAPDILQTFGSLLRNIGLIGMGWTLWHATSLSDAVADAGRVAAPERRA